ncbi:MAG: hypothetical protein FRX49_12702 [Trebouxia sp. A1-2]|nr:MAG: hypothetical protein FRX49_12702 [Trebouxia sp. A1-2]
MVFTSLGTRRLKLRGSSEARARGLTYSQELLDRAATSSRGGASGAEGQGAAVMEGSWLRSSRFDPVSIDKLSIGAAHKEGGLQGVLQVEAADTHVPEHDAAISSSGSKEVTLTTCSFGCLGSLHHNSCQHAQATAVMSSKGYPRKPFDLLGKGGRPSRVKDMPGSHCRSVTQVVWLASTRDRWLPFTTAVMPLSSLPASSLEALPSSPAGLEAKVQEGAVEAGHLLPGSVPHDDLAIVAPPRDHFRLQRNTSYGDSRISSGWIGSRKFQMSTAWDAEPPPRASTRWLKDCGSYVGSLKGRHSIWELFHSSLESLSDRLHTWWKARRGWTTSPCIEFWGSVIASKYGAGWQLTVVKINVSIWSYSPDTARGGQPMTF